MISLDLKDIGYLVSLIMLAARTAISHKEYCQEIMRHVVLRQCFLENIKPKLTAKSRDLLKSYEEVLKNLSNVIQSCENKSYACLFLKGISYQERFRKLGTELHHQADILGLICLEEIVEKNLQSGYNNVNDQQKLNSAKIDVKASGGSCVTFVNVNYVITTSAAGSSRSDFTLPDLEVHNSCLRNKCPKRVKEWVYGMEGVLKEEQNISKVITLIPEEEKKKLKENKEKHREEKVKEKKHNDKDEFMEKKEKDVKKIVVKDGNGVSKGCEKKKTKKSGKEKKKKDDGEVKDSEAKKKKKEKNEEVKKSEKEEQKKDDGEVKDSEAKKKLKENKEKHREEKVKEKKEKVVKKIVVKDGNGVSKESEKKKTKKSGKEEKKKDDGEVKDSEAKKKKKEKNEEVKKSEKEEQKKDDGEVKDSDAKKKKKEEVEKDNGEKKRKPDCKNKYRI